MTQPTFRIEMVCEVIAPDGKRTRLSAFPIPTVCLNCGINLITADNTAGTANMGPTALATMNNRNGLLCAVCTASHRRRAQSAGL